MVASPTKGCFYFPSFYFHDATRDASLFWPVFSLYGKEKPSGYTIPALKPAGMPLDYLLLVFHRILDKKRGGMSILPLF
jgi:hypothetical protein